METVHSSQTSSVNFYQTTRCHILHYSTPCSHRRENSNATAPRILGLRLSRRIYWSTADWCYLWHERPYIFSSLFTLTILSGLIALSALVHAKYRQGKPTYSEKNLSQRTVSTINLSWRDRESNWSRRDGKPGTNSLSYGTVNSRDCFWIWVQCIFRVWVAHINDVITLFLLQSWYLLAVKFTCQGLSNKHYWHDGIYFSFLLCKVYMSFEREYILQILTAFGCPQLKKTVRIQTESLYSIFIKNRKPWM
jgi:hypothetical protein